MIPRVVILIICCLAVPGFYNSCTGCEPANLAVIILVIVYGGLGLLNAILFSFRSRNLPDARGLFVEIRISMRIMGLAIIDSEHAEIVCSRLELHRAFPSTKRAEHVSVRMHVLKREKQ